MQQLTYEKNPNSSLPSCSPKNSADAQVVSCNPQKKPWGSGDGFCSLKREGLQPERRRLTFEVGGRVGAGHGVDTVRPPEPGGLGRGRCLPET